MTHQIDLKPKFLGGMVGSALGDAIGELAFRCREETSLRSEIAQRNVLIYTDDTAMAIGLAESITQVRGIDPQHLGDTFRANLKRETWRGYASGPPTVFSRVEKYGMSYEEAARKLVRKRWLVRLVPGKYLIVPLEAGLESIPMADRYVIAGKVLDTLPYYISHYSALELHQMTTQPVNTVYVTVPRQRTRDHRRRGVPLRLR